MADALIAQEMGKRYQAWLFWEYAYQLLLPDTNVVEVRFEDGVRAFDDVVVRFDPPRVAGYQEWITYLNLQAKYHIGLTGEFSIDSFTDPSFIGAKDATLLSRLGEAYRSLGAADFERRDFWIVSPWAMRSGDTALAQLWREPTQRLNPEVLAQGKQSNSRWVDLRARWRDATGVNSDDDLLAIIKRLRVGYSYGGVSERFAGSLSDKLRAVGLRPIEPYASVEPYSQIPWNLHAQKHTRYTRSDIQRIAEEANLLLPPPNRFHGARLGIRSRVQWGDHMEAECQAVLPLEDLFERRALREGVTWAHVYWRVHEFLRAQSRGGVRKLLELAAPISVAFAAGYALPTRDGRPVFPLQRQRGVETLWDATEPDRTAGGWEVSHDELTGIDGPDIAVGFALSREVWPAMQNYVQRECPQIGRMVELQPLGGPDLASVKGAGHAVHLATEAERFIRNLRASSGSASQTMHLFLAVPNGFAFMLGQEGERLGRFQLYEYDFSGEGDSSYKPSLSVPADTLPIRVPSTSEVQ